MATTLTKQEDGIYTVTGLTTSESSDTLAVGGKAKKCYVHAAAGGGLGFNSGTLTVEVQLHSGFWVPAIDINGDAVTFTADGGNIVDLAGATGIRGTMSNAASADVDLAFALGG